MAPRDIPLVRSPTLRVATGKQPSTYFSPQCLFCGKNNRRRHSRLARTWTCDHCGELNPGPAMFRTLIKGMGERTEPAKKARKTEPPPAAAESGNGNSHAAPKVAKTTIRAAAAQAPAAPKPKAKTAPAKPKPAAAAASEAKKEPRRGFLEGFVYG
jgi:hypothetical protein